MPPSPPSQSNQLLRVHSITAIHGFHPDPALVDKYMVLTALAMIHAESAGFEPISENQLYHNTALVGRPFVLYDNRKDIGNHGHHNRESRAGYLSADRGAVALGNMYHAALPQGND